MFLNYLKHIRTLSLSLLLNGNKTLTLRQNIQHSLNFNTICSQQHTFASVKCWHCTFFTFLEIHFLPQCSFHYAADTVVLQCHTPIGCWHDLQNFHMEVTDSETGHRCLWPCSICKHRKRHTGLHSACWKYTIKRLSFYCGSPDTSVTLLDLSPHRTYTQPRRHTQRACYKNIQVSPSPADGCYYGNTVTNRERVWVGLHQWAGNPAEVNQSRQQQCSACSSSTLLLHGGNVHSMEPDVLRNISHCRCVRRTHSNLL